MTKREFVLLLEEKLLTMKGDTLSVQRQIEDRSFFCEGSLFTINELLKWLRANV